MKSKTVEIGVKSWGEGGLMLGASQIPKIQLVSLYVENGLSTTRVGKILGASNETIRRALILNGIARSRKYTLRSCDWKPEEVEGLRASFPLRNIPINDIAARLGKTVGAVMNKAHDLGLGRRWAWTPIEDSILQVMYRDASKSEILATLKPCSWRRIQSRAGALGIKRISDVSFNNHTIPELTVEERAYLAGLVDGEGSIQISKKLHSSRVVVYNTSKKMIDWCKKILPTGSIKISARGAKWKPCYVFTIYGNSQVNRLLKQLEPYMTSKRERAQHFIRYTDLVGARSRSECPTSEEITIMKQIMARQRR